MLKSQQGIQQSSYLAELHKAHMGIVKMKSVARMYVWWPSMNEDIERSIHECKHCQLQRKNPVNVPSHPWDAPKHPWERVHIDFTGPFKGHMWLILVDALTKWLEVIKMSTTSSEHTVEVLRLLFARYGLPRVIVSDNGTQFTSGTFQMFCKNKVSTTNYQHHAIPARMVKQNILYKRLKQP